MLLDSTACGIVLRHLWDFNHGRIDDKLKEEVEMHLATCGSCRERSETEDYKIEHLG